MARKIERSPGAYCTHECRNKECPVNYKNKKKGEIHIEFKPFAGTQVCHGYIRP